MYTDLYTCISINMQQYAYKHVYKFMNAVK